MTLEGDLEPHFSWITLIFWEPTLFLHDLLIFRGPEIHKNIEIATANHVLRKIRGCLYIVGKWPNSGWVFWGYEYGEINYFQTWELSHSNWVPKSFWRPHDVQLGSKWSPKASKWSPGTPKVRRKVSTMSPRASKVSPKAPQTNKVNKILLNTSRTPIIQSSSQRGRRQWR